MPRAVAGAPKRRGRVSPGFPRAAVPTQWNPALSTSSPCLAWYFDFVSPYAYLQFAAHPELFRREDVVLKPVVFAGLLAHWGHKGPAELPTKRLHTYRQVLWLAAKLGVEMRFPPGHPFNPLHVLRLAVALGAREAPVRTIFEFIWREGRDPNVEMKTLAARLGIPDPAAASGDPDVKAKLRTNGEEAIGAGVFGVPTFAVAAAKPGGVPLLFWGCDSTPMLRDYLADPRLFESDTMRALERLPFAAARKA